MESIASGIETLAAVREYNSDLSIVTYEYVQEEWLNLLEKIIKMFYFL